MTATGPSTRRTFLAGLAAAAAAPSAIRAAKDFQSLFNDKDLTGWEGDHFLWKVEGGELVGRSPGISYNDFLATEESFDNFLLQLEVRLLSDEGNSGVQFRSERVPGSMEMIGYQADIGPGWWGNLYDESRRRRNLVEADPKVIERLVKKNDWNAYEVRAEADKITLRLNGRVTADYVEPDGDVARKGRIAVQIHSGPPLEVRFRNIRIQKL